MKNYIEMFMVDNGLKVNEQFKINDGTHLKYQFIENKDGEIELIDSRLKTTKIYLIDLLSGAKQIEKIKYKTLVEQLKEQGYCFFIVYNSRKCDYIIKKINVFKLGDLVSGDFFLR